MNEINQMNQMNQNSMSPVSEMSLFPTKFELWPKLGLVLIWAGPKRN